MKLEEFILKLKINDPRVDYYLKFNNDIELAKLKSSVFYPNIKKRNENFDFSDTLLNFINNYSQNIGYSLNLTIEQEIIFDGKFYTIGYCEGDIIKMEINGELCLINYYTNDLICKISKNSDSFLCVIIELLKPMDYYITLDDNLSSLFLINKIKRCIELSGGINYSDFFIKHLFYLDEPLLAQILV